MRVRNWLLTGTSLTLLALAPATAARAQDASDPALVSAYQAFSADQSEENRQKLTEACIAAGFASLDDCISAVSAAQPAPAPAAPSSEAPPPPEPSSEQPPPPSEEAPPPEPSSEQPPPPAPSSEEEAPPPAAPSSEEAPPPPAPSSETVTPAEPSSSEEAPPEASSSEEAPPPAPSSEEAAPVAPSEEAAPVAPSSEEAAPVTSSEEAAPVPPSSEEAAPVAPSSGEEAAPASSEAQPATPSSEQPANNALAQLTAAVNLYNEGVTDLTAGDSNGQAKIDQANAQITQICTDAGFADTATCLAQFGLTLNPLPAQPGETSSSVPAASSEQPTETSSAPPEGSSIPPISELPQASEAVTPSAVEVLPSQVESEAAPLLDSAKDQTTTPSASSEQPSASSEQPPAPSEPPAPPPQDDKQAQADIQPPAPEQQSALTDKGQKIEVQQIPVAPPTDNKNVKVIQPPPPKNNNNAPPPQNNGIIIQIGVNIIIKNPEQERDRYYDPQEDEIYYEDIGRGRTREVVTRPNGTKIVTVRNRNGDVLQRSKVLPNGREIVLATYDPRDRDIEDWNDPGDELPPLHLTIPASDYILDTRHADEQDVYDFLDQPPVEKVRRIYTIDEVKRSARLRDSVRRLEVGNLTFDSGRATIARNQVGALSGVADAMQKLLDRNPGEVFLIEGHTDAVGSDVANLVLSDQRAATVARILTDFYGIPPENLVTQGYGERYLKVQTEAAEPLNRRVTIKRITPLISYVAAQ